MRPAAALVPFFALLAGVGAFATAYTAKTNPPARPAADDRPRVKLAVLVVFDQMRGDYLEKWKPLFGPAGFARLQSEGAHFTRCYYPYATTTTGPGHASMLTGTCPDRHGIVNNNWTEKGRDVYCAAAERYKLVPAIKPPPPDKDGKVAAPKAGGTPERLLTETLADVLKSVNPRSKVFGLSLKDRSAILPTGRRPDGAYWFDGRFGTSDYYADRVHLWVESFNASKAADRWFARDWVRFRQDLDYARFSGPDDAAGEGKGTGQGRTFPHPMAGGKTALGKEYYEALADSPHGNELLLEFAKACVTAERLGADDDPDLLVVSFSSNDLIGHTWGPDSQEVLDVTLRSDALMAEFLAFLDQKVGKGNYALAMTADHGICPLPEVSAAKGRDAKRVDPDALRAAAEGHLRATFGGPAADAKNAPKWFEAFQAPWIYLNPNLVKASGKDRGEVARSLADHLMRQPEVMRAFTRDELAGDTPAEDEMAVRVRRSFHPARCGDVYVVLKPYYLLSKPLATGTTHGTPHGYDAHVPLLVYGPGVEGGPRTEPVAPQAAATILARFLAVRPPRDAEFPVPATLEGR